MAFYLYKIQDSYIPVEAANRVKALKIVKDNIRLVATMSKRTIGRRHSPVNLLGQVDARVYDNFRFKYCKFLTNLE